MEKNYKRVPFDIELAKDITRGKVKGRIYFETTLADQSKTDTWIIKSIHDLKNEIDPYYVISECDSQEYIEYLRADGYIPQQLVNAVIELSEETPKHEFKPFDKVLVRNNNNQAWRCDVFSHMSLYDNEEYRCIGAVWTQCIPYEGNEHLVGTTENPKEE